VDGVVMPASENLHICGLMHRSKVGRGSTTAVLSLRIGHS
jgi:hypothetical protein